MATGVHSISQHYQVVQSGCQKAFPCLCTRAPESLVLSFHLQNISSSLLLHCSIFHHLAIFLDAFYNKNIIFSVGYFGSFWIVLEMFWTYLSLLHFIWFVFVSRRPGRLPFGTCQKILSVPLPIHSSVPFSLMRPTCARHGLSELGYQSECNLFVPMQKKP